MGRNQQLRRKIAGRERVIEAHQDKIQAESAKPRPDEVLINGWEREIEIHRKAIEKLVRRLKREW